MRSRAFYGFFLLLLLLPDAAGAWWNDDWAFRKRITVNTTEAGAPIQGTVESYPVLVRLHFGNFTYFQDMQGDGADLRFIADDDRTPLAFHVERFDSVNGMALIWVQVPRIVGGTSTTSLWMYYGNPEAKSAADAGATYDKDQVLVYHFNGPDGAPVDATAYGNNPSAATVQHNPASVMGGGALFADGGTLTIPATPSLVLSQEEGWTVSAWLRAEDVESDAVVLDAGGLQLRIGGGAVYARVADANGAWRETPRSASLTAGQWHHVALVASAGRSNLYVDGEFTGAAGAVPPSLERALVVGAGAQGESPFAGEMDELQIAKVPRQEQWVELMASNQGPQGSLLRYGDDEAKQGAGASESYFVTILRNVSADGWVVIALLAAMAAFSWAVMVVKAFTLSRAYADNKSFLHRYQELTPDQTAALDREDDSDEQDEPELLTAMFGEHDRFASSNLYRVYHVGVKETKARIANRKVLPPQAIDAIRASLDAAMVRETQRLNRQMVLLTIAISGGPFLGLLGTVIGVMITFAAIAATGDVNIAAIAPGVSAALMTTVFGLIVAIPALFGYNYLATRVRDIVADMTVFADEFISRVAEQYSD